VAKIITVTTSAEMVVASSLFSCIKQPILCY
jgi:hypothetical protein